MKRLINECLVDTEKTWIYELDECFDNRKQFIGSVIADTSDEAVKLLLELHNKQCCTKHEKLPKGRVVRGAMFAEYF